MLVKYKKYSWILTHFDFKNDQTVVTPVLHGKLFYLARTWQSNEQCTNVESLRKTSQILPWLEQNNQIMRKDLHPNNRLKDFQRAIERIFKALQEIWGQKISRNTFVGPVDESFTYVEKSSTSFVGQKATEESGEINLGSQTPILWKIFFHRSAAQTIQCLYFSTHNCFLGWLHKRIKENLLKRWKENSHWASTSFFFSLSL